MQYNAQHMKITLDVILIS